MVHLRPKLTLWIAALLTACPVIPTSAAAGDSTQAHAPQSTSITPSSPGDLYAQTEELTPIPEPGVLFKNREIFGATVAVADDVLAVGAPDAPLGGGVYLYYRDGESWSLHQKVRNAEGAYDSAFGRAVALTDRTLVVGAPYGHSSDTWQCGAVYIFELVDDRWQQIQRINAEDAEADARFGTSVAISGDLLVVGAYDASGATRPGTGAVYVFRMIDGRWTQAFKITRPNEDEERYFGTSVATDGDIIAAASPARSQTSGNRWGEVFVFGSQGSDWVLEQQIDLAGVGWSRGALSLHDQWMAVAGNLDSTIDEARAIIYERREGEWVHDQTIAPESPEGEFIEVEKIQITADRMIMATHLDDGAADDPDAVLVYSRSGGNWISDAKLTVPDSSPNEDLGRSIAMAGRTIVAGSRDMAVAHVFEEAAGSWNHSQVLVPWNVESARMGSSLAVSGNTMVAGAPGYDHDGLEVCGAVWVYRFDGEKWDMQEMILADEPGAWEQFGAAVGLWDDTLVVGAPDRAAHSDGPGAAYVYRRIDDEWRFIQKLTGRGSSSYDRFGAAVAVDENWIFVSDPSDLEGGQTGAVYVYELVGGFYEQRQIIMPDRPAQGDYFGETLLLHNGELLIGALYRDGGHGASTGAVFVFSKAGGIWSEQQEIAAADPSVAIKFGSSLAADDSTLVVGAPGYDSPDKLFAGTVYVFKKVDDDWVEQDTLVPRDAAPLSGVGAAVAITGNRILVGVPSHDVGGVLGAGAVYVFTPAGDQWSEQMLTVPDPEIDDGFGETASAVSGSFLISAPSETTVWGIRAGSVYVFEPAVETVDLDVTISNERDVCVPGESMDYTIVFANRSSTDVHNARVIATFPREFLADNREWSCQSTGGATCNLPLWTKRLHEDVDLPAGSSLQVTARGTMAPNWDDELTSFPAAVLPPPGFADTDTANNEAVDTDAVEPRVDLVATITNGRDYLFDGQRTSYGIAVQNPGPSLARLISVVATPPESLVNCSWTCHDESWWSFSKCLGARRGEGVIDEEAYINPGHAVYYVLTCDVDAVSPTCTTPVEVSTDHEIDVDETNNHASDEDPIIEPPGGLAREVSGRRSP
ncbi:MAG: FG-GAP repeat protein [Candidatus Sulfomarinibacteraceae bacterium]